MITPFEYCTKCGLVYCHIQNFECVVCHGNLAPIEGLSIPRSAKRSANRIPNFYLNLITKMSNDHHLSKLPLSKEIIISKLSSRFNLSPDYCKEIVKYYYDD